MTQRRQRRSINASWVIAPPDSLEAGPHGDEDDHGRRGQALQAPRLAEAETLAHREPQVEAATMNQQALQDVLVSAQMRASHPPGFI